MTKTENLLVTLMEECDELEEELLNMALACGKLSKRCAKNLRFGLNEVQPEQEFCNGERISIELADLIGTYQKLQDVFYKNKDCQKFNLWDIDSRIMKEYIDKKKDKLEHCFKLSQAEGTLEV